MALKSTQLSGLSKDEEGDLKGSFLSALIYRKSLAKHLTQKIEAKREKASLESFIVEGDFAVKMAWAMGYEKAQRELLNLIE